MYVKVDFPGVSCADCEQKDAVIRFHADHAPLVAREMGNLREEVVNQAAEIMKLKAELEFFKSGNGTGGLSQ